jgi:glycosyltransferase involved in cell wall biosynthesis
MLTVLLATRNGDRTLSGVLEAFTHVQAPPSGWKLVVVDNGSTDRTHEIVTSFQSELPLTYKFEGRVGKNFALNTGLAELEGDLAVFTDDDVFPNPNWLVRLRAAADVRSAYSMFGGVILPRWEVSPPQWVGRLPRGPVFTLSDPSLTDGPTKPGNLFGPNMAIRSEIFKSGAHFDTTIGPSGTDYPMGSESELVEKLGRQGHKAWHVHDAIVEHFIRDHQLDKSWILKRAIRFGRGQLRLSRAAEPGVVQSWFGVERGHFPRMLKGMIRIATAWLTSNEQELMLARWDFNNLLGQFIEARRLRTHQDDHGTEVQARPADH